MLGKALSPAVKSLAQIKQAAANLSPVERVELMQLLCLSQAEEDLGRSSDRFVEETPTTPTTVHSNSVED